MKNISLAIGLALGTLFFGSCNQASDKKNNDRQTDSTLTTTSDFTIAGNYVSPDYENRNGGYDWVGIQVGQNANNSIKIQIRSRADLKKPTCTLDAIAHPISENVYKAMLEGKSVLFTFSENGLSIDAENETDTDILSFYCSGGATLKGTYKKIAGELDSSQIDTRSYIKTLSLQNISFFMDAKLVDGKKILTITPTGLSIDNRPFTHDITGQSIVDAEIEDLNKDGFPEIMIYTQSDGSGSYGDVIAYSVNNGKSMSQITFPRTAENKEINEGYSGHDEFALVEHSLAQRFPIYKDGDTNAKPTGKSRQVEYKLKDGEASRVFVVHSVVEF